MMQHQLSVLEPKKIIVLRALFLGDLLCALPAFKALRRRFPSAEVTLVGLPWAADLVDRSPFIDRFVPSPGFAGIPEVPYAAERTEAFFHARRRENYDVAIQLHGSGSNSNDVIAQFGARHSIGFGFHDDDRLTWTVPWDENEQEVLRCLRPMALLGADISDTGIDFPISDDEWRRGQSLLDELPPTGGPIIGLHLGAKDPRRRWPPERFAVLGDALSGECDARIVLTGSHEECDLGETVCRSMRFPTLNLAGRTDLGVLAAVISSLDLLVTNDTGVSHLAASTRTPSLVLFGFARPERWAPLDRSLHEVIDAVTYGGRSNDPATALRQLPVEHVLSTSKRLLATPRRGARNVPAWSVRESSREGMSTS